MACFLWTFGQLWTISNRFCPQNCPCQWQPSWHMKQHRADRGRPESLSFPHFVIVSPLSSPNFRSFSNRWTSPSLSIRGGGYLLLKKVIISLFLYFYLTRYENMFSSLIWKLANSAIHLRLMSGILHWKASLDEMIMMRQLAWKVHGVGRRRHLELGHLRRRVLHSTLHNSALEL